MARRGDGVNVGSARSVARVKRPARPQPPQPPQPPRAPQQPPHHDLEALSNDPGVIVRQQALLREITMTLLITLALFLGLHSSAQAVPLDGPSMQPGLHTDERVLVNSLAYTFRGPERGDVIVFHPPTAPNERYIKRVIGLPGDTITLTADQVIVNGVTLDEPYITSAPPGESENPEPAIIKLNATQYFVMGDNRTNSEDSRFFGPISQHAIIGKAQFVVWPISSLHSIDTYPAIYSQVPDASAPTAAPLSLLALTPLLG